MANKAILFDSSKCIACRACQVACKQWWELPAVSTINKGTYENPVALSPQTWNRILFTEVTENDKVRWLFTRRACMHCTKAVCVWVCPSYARAYHELGFVTIDQERCIACGRCIEYCPFKLPKLGENGVSPRVTIQMGAPRPVAYKCKFCEDRVEEGSLPSCVKTCPTGALQFGERDDLVRIGVERTAKLKGTFPRARLYGQTELGGLHSMYLLTEEPDILGLPMNPQFGTYPKFDENTFPDWYVNALADGKLPRFPVEGRREWYMEPDLSPKPTPIEPAWPAHAVKPSAEWAKPALLGWLGVGVAGAGAALWWTLRRRMMLKEQEQKSGEE